MAEAMIDERTRQVAETADRIKPLLTGLGPDVQGAVLAELFSLWLAGHVCVGDAEATEAMREEQLQIWLETARDLVRINAEEIGTDNLARKLS